MERIVLVHGSVTGGAATWGRTVEALQDRFELLVVERPGFPPLPPVERVDFERDAELVAGLARAGDHLVGHSYGAVVSLLAAAAQPKLVRSLTVIEPPCTSVALDDPAVVEFARTGAEWYAHGPEDLEVFLRGFLATVGSPFEPPSPLPPELEQGAQALRVERGPWEAKIPLDELRAAPFPKLVVSGDHSAAFDSICDVLERELPAERAVLPGYGHVAQRHPDFPALLADFVERAA